ncbi:MAG: hypothetical protein IJE23_04470 [Tyzzerella sp.]|nr:hypothetical protein [Tyzzerella sp.]
MYGNENFFAPTGAEEMVAVGVILIFLLLYLVIAGMGLASYIMNAIALYKIADRRQIPNPWMAWLPFTSDWLLGSIVDDYDGRNGIKRKWRVTLLALSLISAIGILVTYIAMFVGIIVLAFQYTDIEPPIGPTLAYIMILYIALIIFALLASAKGICQIVCIYKIYESTVPKKAVKYLLLSMLIPLAGPICLLRCKDKGYPYPEQQEFISYEVAEVTDIADESEEEFS